MEQQEEMSQDRFGRTQEQKEQKVEVLFDAVCQLKMRELVELSELLCSRLSLKVVGGFVNALEAQAPDARAEAKEMLVVVVKAGAGSRVEAMKNAKAILGLGLKEARDFVEGLPRSMEPEESEAEARAKAQKWIDGGFVVELV